MMNELIQLDQQLFLYLNSLGTPLFDGFWMFITGKWNAIPFYLFLIYLLYKKMGLKQFLVTLLCVAVLVTLTDQLANLFKKVLFLRLRPCHEDIVASSMRLVKSSCGGKYGYFSAHAASAMGVAVFLGKVFKPYYTHALKLLLVWAVLVGYSRIYIGVHYPADVLTGMFFGVIIAILLHQIYTQILRKILNT